ncbi:sensor histidine kinase [uncultured Chitinophaga sp.]|uniref:sensor histidine kinase n=1 Tax=uncultured Chitinophaga sp. TaxID=339340 RepID=UPI0025F52AEC|nr:histidine kinase [uncultured Chitinophaga sp.]
MSRIYFWIYAGLLLWGCLLFTQPEGGWDVYFQAFLFGCLQLWPVLAFSWFSHHKPRLFRPLTFLLALPLTSYICLALNADPELIVGMGATAIVLELLFMLDVFYRQRARNSGWLRQPGLEHAVLITIGIIAVALSAMAVSSMDDPAYNSGGQLLIGFEFSIIKVVRNFGTFLVFCLQFILMYLCGYAFFFINSRYLVPIILKQKGILIYLLSGMAVVAFLAPLLAQLVILLPLNRTFGQIFPSNPLRLENAAAGIFIILLSLPIVLALQYARQNNRILSLEKEKARTELDLLKQQINPHFFFNTLNNLYALSMQQSAQTSESILQLSELMRYTIYKGQLPAVAIREEIKYVQDYIQLQQIRLKNTADITFDILTQDEEQLIPPMLLIVFVENAFKHGIENAEDAALLRISLQCSERRLYFCCENSFEEGHETPGIGLSNLRKRLELLYPGRHELRTTIKNHTFKAELQLEL